MKSRMFVVDDESLASTIATNIASIKVPVKTNTIMVPKGSKTVKKTVTSYPLQLDKDQWVKTVSDIMADLLQIEKGDYIFLWQTKHKNQKSRIHGVYRAISDPYYDSSDPNDEAPFKIHIEKAFDFSNPIDEYDVLNCPYIKTALWTIIGKKVANKSRGTSPLSLEEARHLITLLSSKNPGNHFIPANPARWIPVTNPLRVGYANRGTNPSSIFLSALNPNTVNYFSSSSELYFEKTLETIFNQEMVSRNNAFFSQLGITPSKVIWYSNYLPYSVEQSEMDYVILESDDGFSLTKIHVVDFMKTEVDDDHIHRVLLYCKWLNDTMGLGGNITRPVIVCKLSANFSSVPLNTKYSRLQSVCQSNEQQYNCQPLEIYEYDFSTGVPTFTKKR